MAYSIIAYRGGLMVDPKTVIGDGGQFIVDNFEELLDRTGPAHRGAGPPTPQDDEAGTAGNGLFFDLSHWIDINSGEIYVCLDSTVNNAEWTLVGATKPAPPDFSVQFNGGAEEFEGAAEFIWDDVVKRLEITGDLLVSDTLVGNIAAFADHVSFGNATFVPTSSSIWSDDAGNLSFFDTVVGEVVTLSDLDVGDPDTSVQFNDGGAFAGSPDLTWDGESLNLPAADFAPGPVPAYQEGRIFYDEQDKAFSGYVDAADVKLNIGEETWAKVRNNSGATILNGTPIRVTGALGNRPTIAPAQADDPATTGAGAVATHDIANNADGYVTTFGLVRDLDLSAFAEGTVLFLSATVAGGLTDTPPDAPNFRRPVGLVLRSHVNEGILLVSPHTVDPTRATTMNDLDLLGDLTVAGSIIIGGPIVAKDGIFPGKVCVGIDTLHPTDYLHVQVPNATDAGILLDNPNGDSIRIALDTIGRSQIISSASTTYSTAGTMTISGNTTVIAAVGSLFLGPEAAEGRFFHDTTATPYLYVGGYHTTDAQVRSMWALSNSAGHGYWIGYNELRLCGGNSTVNRFTVDVDGNAGLAAYNKNLFVGTGKEGTIYHDGARMVIDGTNGVHIDDHVGVMVTPSTSYGLRCHVTGGITGIYGQTDNGFAVQGMAAGGTALRADNSAGGYAVRGEASANATAGFFRTVTGIGLWGQTSTNYAGYFTRTGNGAGVPAFYLWNQSGSDNSTAFRIRNAGGGRHIQVQDGSAVDLFQVTNDGTVVATDYLYNTHQLAAAQLVPMQVLTADPAEAVEYQPGVIAWSHARLRDESNWFISTLDPAVVDTSQPLTFQIAWVYDSATTDTVEFGLDVTVIRSGVAVPATVNYLSGPVTTQNGIVAMAEISVDISALTAVGQISFRIYRNRGGPNDTLNADVFALGYYAYYYKKGPN